MELNTAVELDVH